MVRNRLTDVGLGSYLLELHSAKATRKQVAGELGLALTTEPVPPDVLAGLTVQQALQGRQRLNAYADAMNRPREPLSHSLHHVLGIIAMLKGVPAAPLAGIPMTDLTVAKYSEVKSVAKALAGAWRPARQGATFAWRGVVQRGSLEALLYRASSALATLSGTAGCNSALGEATGLSRPSDALALAALLDHQSARPAALPGDWLTMDHLKGVEDSIGKLDSSLTEIRIAEHQAADAASTPWQVVPQSADLPVVPDFAGAFPATPDVDDWQATEVTSMAAEFRSAAAMLTARARSLATLAGMLGLRAPATFAEADDLLSLALLAQSPVLPERAWPDPEGHARAVAAADALHAAESKLRQAESAAIVYYTPLALGEDVEGLAARTAARHALAKLSGDHRSDKKTIASFTAEGAAKDAAQQHLGLAVAWKQAASAAEAAQRAHARALGAFYAGIPADFPVITAALDVAAATLRLARGQGTGRLADYLARDGSRAGETSIVDMAQAIGRDLRAWRTAPATPPELPAGPIGDAVTWLSSQAELLDIIAGRTAAVGGAVGRTVTVGLVRRLVSLRDRADAAHERLTALTVEFSDAFGTLYDGPRTDIAAVRQAIGWARRMRELVTGSSDSPLTDAQDKALGIVRPTPGLTGVASEWQAACSLLLAAFDTERQATMAAELDDYADAEDLIKELRDDPGGQDEWHAYRQARGLLEESGLSAAISFCVSERIPAQQVPDVIERALLQEWAEHVIKTDPALSEVRAAERDALVAEYRKADRQLVSAAVGNIIRACGGRRPRTDVGESATILREASKKRKHMPVRRLLESTRNVTQAIKPCFMMSPLTVSQFLPPDMHFDVVIFDEASQVLPGDAINCVYRGSSLILAGDQNQLPPTSWLFGSIGGDGDDEWSEDADDSADFESILDLAKSAGVFRSLTLRWHRRSRHESLIAFSNFTFYDGKIITFPGARTDGPDVGVELFHVNGAYRRGTSRDNPVEAAKVAERTIHHYDTRPGKSLGVIAFSEAQANAIEAAVSEARQSRPDLDRFFDGNDRLRGFFIKNLEAVQGDERDVLIFSIGYGPDENGKLTMTFGPLNKQGGWRRLNVAITRALYRNEIVSSIRAGDIPASVTSRGVRNLRGYLDFAHRGMDALALDASTSADAESPFEESVISVIRSLGYDVSPQVGTAGYRVDIGVHHPEQPGAYALGVECDGYQYHSSRVARDRDRLRQDVLTGLGWRLHRIWGTAWYRDRAGAEAALLHAIENATAAPAEGLLPGDPGLGAASRPVVRSKAATFDQAPAWVHPYAVASVAQLPRWVDPGGVGSGQYMDGAIKSIVATEGPVHMDTLFRRLRDAWEIGRIGKNIRENIDIAIIKSQVTRRGSFLIDPDAPITVRTPTDQCQRAITQVHESELDLALLKLVSDAAGISQDELTARTARIYGWERRGSDITPRLDERISALLATGQLTGTPDNLTTARRPEDQCY